MLAPYRVIDLCDERGALCGALFAALGADVVMVEPPEGGSVRTREPVRRGDDGAPESAWHWSYSRGKRSVVIDVETTDGRRALHDLIRGADVVIESYGPSEAARLGLCWDDVGAVEPGVVLVSISPFGHRGPKAGWPATDLTVAAAAGVLILTGDEDRGPVPISVPQAFLHASAEAFGAALVALTERTRSGHGQHVDVSAQEAFAAAAQSAVVSAMVGHHSPERSALGSRTGKYTFRNVYRCRDGHTSLLFQFSPAFATANRALLDWAASCGFSDPVVDAEEWSTYRERLSEQSTDLSRLDRLFGLLERFLVTRTKAELLDAAIERGVLVAPLSTIDDVLGSEHLAQRDCWEDVRSGSGTTVRAPISWFASAGRRALRPGPPPGLGEHTAEVLAESGRRPGSAPSGPAPSDPPLAGLKVLDFTWVLAGPAATRTLADAGATVVRIQSRRRADPIHAVSPFVEGVAGPGRSVSAQVAGAGKLSLGLDLTHEGARAVIDDLVGWADLVVESFAPGALGRLGLGYDDLREIRPDLVMASTCLMGQTGPLARLAGYGTMAAALAGFGELVGWPDRHPVGPYGAYTDYISPRFVVGTVLAALDHRRRTGEGAHLDLSHMESSLWMLAPALLERGLTGARWERCGDADRHLAPSGVFSVLGDDEWVALGCRDDEDWRTLATLVGRSDLAVLDRAERRRRDAELRAVIAAWTGEQGRDAVVDRLVSAGVPAHGVSRSIDFVADPHLVERSHIRCVPSSSFAHSEVFLEGPRAHLSRTPLDVRFGAPRVGEHSEHVLVDLLGFSPDRVAELIASGIVEPDAT